MSQATFTPYHGSRALECGDEGESPKGDSPRPRAKARGTGFADQQQADTNLRARAAVYLLFARLFRDAPTPELLQEIVQHRVLSNADSQWPHQAEAIAVEYARLFAVPGEQAVQPYESVYCDTLTIDETTACSPYFLPEPQRAGGLTGFLHGSSTIAVREAYRQAGFELDPTAHELPDHLAVELEFMARLLERGATEAAAFFRDHLGRWVFPCLSDVQQRAQRGFFHEAAASLTEFMQGEHALLLTQSDAP